MIPLYFIKWLSTAWIIFLIQTCINGSRIEMTSYFRITTPLQMAQNEWISIYYVIVGTNPYKALIFEGSLAWNYVKVSGKYFKIFNIFNFVWWRGRVDFYWLKTKMMRINVLSHWNNIVIPSNLHFGFHLT